VISPAALGESREERPAFDALAKDAARRRLDIVMAWSVDRLGRSLEDLVGFLSDLHADERALFRPGQLFLTVLHGFNKRP